MIGEEVVGLIVVVVVVVVVVGIICSYRSPKILLFSASKSALI